MTSHASQNKILIVSPIDDILDRKSDETIGIGDGIYRGNDRGEVYSLRVSESQKDETESDVPSPLKIDRDPTDQF